MADDSGLNRQRAWRVAAPLVLGLCGILLATSFRNAGGEDFRSGPLTELPDLVRAEERRNRELERQIEELNDDIEALSAHPGSTAIEGYEAQVDALVPAVGMTAVEGPGITVTLDDAPLPPNSDRSLETFDLDEFLVHQQDLEGVMNAMWAGGAEAMGVMDQRIVSTSSVLCVGSQLLLHARPYSPPYTITAVGDVDGMLAALESEPSVRLYRATAAQIGLGYDVELHESVELPAYDGPIEVSAGTAS